MTSLTYHVEGAINGEHSFDDSPQARALFHESDHDSDGFLVYGEFQGVFRKFDNDSKQILKHFFSFLS